MKTLIIVNLAGWLIALALIVTRNRWDHATGAAAPALLFGCWLLLHTATTSWRIIEHYRDRTTDWSGD